MNEDDERAALDHQAQLEERRRRLISWNRWAVNSKRFMAEEIARQHHEFEQRQRRLEEWLTRA